MTTVLNMMLGRGRGGLERASAHYHHALAARGYRVVTVGHPDGWLRSQLPPGAAFVAMAPFTDYDFRAHFALQRAVLAHAPSVVLAHGNRAMRYAARLVGVSRVGVLHNSRFKPATGLLDACIAVTHALATAARQRYPGLVVEVVSNLIYLTSDGTRPERRRPLVIGALGRLHMDKGFDYLIEALADPRLADQKWRLMIAGEGPEQAILSLLAKKRGIADRIDFIGWVEDRGAFFRAIDILCMPSRNESFGMVLIEALAHAVPVIASDNPGCREIIVADRDALVVRSGDLGRLAEAIVRLITDNEFAAALGRAGRDHIVATYAFPVVAEKLDQVMRRLLAPTPVALAASAVARPSTPTAPS